ncbi:MAG TPA: hypothetical protein VNM43_09735 [Dehalococcoidia bacterium]|nr:hypothetical protein [Dehalococcoidia bacterium]
MARAQGPTLSRPIFPTPLLRLGRLRAQAFVPPLRHAPLYAVLTAVFAFHASTLGHPFFGDDFVTLNDITHRSFFAYMRDVLLLRDLTPHWRPVSMLVYWVEFQVFGLDATGFRVVNLMAHLGAVACLYAFAVNQTKRTLVAAAAAGYFGLTASHVHTVTYVTALPHVLATFLLLASLLAAQRWLATREEGWRWASVALYAAGALANEASAVFGAVIALYLFLSGERWTGRTGLFVALAPFGVVAFAIGAVLASCRCAGDSISLSSPGHAFETLWVYLSRLAYPVGELPPGAGALEWTIGSLVAASILVALAKGPLLARLAGAGVIVMLAPYAPVQPWTATRYTYAGAAFFGLLLGVAVALAYDLLRPRLPEVAHALGGLAATLFVAGMGVQTHAQNGWFVRWADSWGILSSRLREAEPTLPQRSYLVILDGEWSHSLWVPTWVPSVAQTLYGDALARDLPTWLFQPSSGALAVLPEYGWGAQIVQYDGSGRFRPFGAPEDETSDR